MVGTDEACAFTWRTVVKVANTSEMLKAKVKAAKINRGPILDSQLHLHPGRSYPNVRMTQQQWHNAIVGQSVSPTTRSGFKLPA